MDIANKLNTIADNMTRVYEAGKAAAGLELERIANRVCFDNLNLFGKEEVTLNLDNATTLNALCRTIEAEKENTTVKHLTINCLKPITNISQMLEAANKDNTLERITFNVDISTVQGVTYMFSKLAALKVIDGTPLDFSSMANISTTTFAACHFIEEIRFKPNSIFVNFPIHYPQTLSTESIESIIDGLADLTGGTAQTLTLNKTVGNKLTDEQKEAIAAKNWTLAY